jgi:DNA-binding CsgD family transcriptional regulator
MNDETRPGQGAGQETTVGRMVTPSVRVADNRTGELDLLAGLRDGAWLDRQTFPPLAYAVEPVIPEGTVLLVGAPKVGKSWLVLGVALGVADGGRALGSIPVARRRVLYLALEDGHRRLQDRCRRLLHGQSIPPGFEYLTTLAGPGHLLDTVGAWLDRQHDTPPLVIIDTLGKVLPPAFAGESPYQRDYRAGSALKQISDGHVGMTLLVNHHDRKADADDFVDAVSGTHGLAGSADAVVVVHRPRHEETGVLRVTGRDVPEAEFAVLFRQSGWALDGPDSGVAEDRARQRRATQGLADRSAEIVGFVAAHPEGVRPAEVALALRIDRATVDTYLGRLVKAGRIRRAARGIYAPV